MKSNRDFMNFFLFSCSYFDCILSSSEMFVKSRLELIYRFTYIASRREKQNATMETTNVVNIASKSEIIVMVNEFNFNLKTSLIFILNSPWFPVIERLRWFSNFAKYVCFSSQISIRQQSVIVDCHSFHIHSSNYHFMQIIAGSNKYISRCFSFRQGSALSDLNWEWKSQLFRFQFNYAIFSLEFNIFFIENHSIVHSRFPMLIFELLYRTFLEVRTNITTSNGEIKLKR